MVLGGGAVRGNGLRNGGPRSNGSCDGAMSIGARRHWLFQLLAMVLTLSLVTGVAVVAVARVRRRERDGVDSMQIAPLAIAHRGDDSAPENSLQAIANAGERGADYAEIDIRLTADGTPVVFHDRRTGRLAADGRDVPVSSLSTRALLHMPMRQRNEDFHVPTLDEAIATAQHANDHLGLLLDLKTGSKQARKLTNAVAERVRRRRFMDRVMFMSTNDDAIAALRKRHPYWTVGKCISPAGRPRIVWPRGVSFVVMRGNRLDQSVLRRARRDDVPVYAGVGSDYNEARKCLRLGADGVLGASARSVRALAKRFAVTVQGSDGSSERPGAGAGADGNRREIDSRGSWTDRPVWHER